MHPGIVQPYGPEIFSNFNFSHPYGAISQGLVMFHAAFCHSYQERELSSALEPANGLQRDPWGGALLIYQVLSDYGCIWLKMFCTIGRQHKQLLRKCNQPQLQYFLITFHTRQVGPFFNLWESSKKFEFAELCALLARCVHDYTELPLRLPCLIINICSKHLQ